MSFDSFLENISPAALPTMLMGKLMNVTNVFQQASTDSASAESEPLENDQKQQSASLLSSVRIPYMSSNTGSGTRKKEDAAALTTSPNEMTTSSLASRLKRNSLFFNKSNSSTKDESSDASPSQSPPSSNNASQDYFRGAADKDQEQQQQYQVQPITITKTRPHSGSYSLSKIPRAVTDAIKHQVLRSDTATTASSAASSSVPVTEEPPSSSSTAAESQSTLSTKSGNRSRSTSLSNFKHHISPYYLYSKINGSTGNNTSASTLPAPHIFNTSLTNTNTDISLLSDADSSSLSKTTTQPAQTAIKNRKQRAKSMGSTLISGTWSKLAPGGVDYYFHQQHMNESQHRHPKGPLWLSDKMIDALEEAAKASVSDHSDSASTNSSSNEEEEDEVNFALDVQVHKTVADPSIRQEEQRTVNEHLNANFPMLLKTEVAEAGKSTTYCRMFITCELTHTST